MNHVSATIGTKAVDPRKLADDKFNKRMGNFDKICKQIDAKHDHVMEMLADIQEQLRNLERKQRKEAGVRFCAGDAQFQHQMAAIKPTPSLSPLFSTFQPSPQPPPSPLLTTLKKPYSIETPSAKPLITALSSQIETLAILCTPKPQNIAMVVVNPKAIEPPLISPAYADITEGSNGALVIKEFHESSLDVSRNREKIETNLVEIGVQAMEEMSEWVVVSDSARNAEQTNPSREILQQIKASSDTKKTKCSQAIHLVKRITFNRSSISTETIHRFLSGHFLHSRILAEWAEEPPDIPNYQPSPFKGKPNTLQEKMAAKILVISPMLNMFDEMTERELSSSKEVTVCMDLGEKIHAHMKTDLYRVSVATSVDQDFGKKCNEAMQVFDPGGSALDVRVLKSVGADVNLQLFRGYAAAAAAREGHYEILEILLKAGASQPACEEALLEVSSHGHSHLVELLMGSDLIRLHVAVHALVTACCRGFVEVVGTLVKCGVDANATDRVLLQSCKPSLHTNADCNALVAAVVSRQISVVRLLLKANVRTDVKVHLGAWSWDMASGEEFRVGAGLAEPYPITWCAVEYFEATGCILQMLLECISPDAPHFGRTLLHHAILCDNEEAVKVLLKCGAAIETPVMTTQQIDFRPIHMAARLGFSMILQTLIDSGSYVNSTTLSGETALMISVRYKQEECLRVLANAGADFGLVNMSGQSAASIARSRRWYIGFQQVLLNVIRSGTLPTSTNKSVFSSLLFVAGSGDVLSLKAVTGGANIELDEQDDRGFSAVMIAAAEGHVDAFRLLVYAGADVKLCNKSGETAITLSKISKNSDLFEKVMLEFALEKGNRISGGFYALHYAARRGDSDAVKLLASKGYDINASDGEGYSPLMLAAREGNGKMCKLLISNGADFDMKNAKGECALSIARKHGKVHNEAEDVILNALACKMVTDGSRLQKHTKGGRGSPHTKLVKVIPATGVLRWGKSSCRNVICREAEVGLSSSFQGNRRRKGDGGEGGVFRVTTTKNKEVHFVCDGGVEVAELWVRGIRLMTGDGDGIFGK